MAPDADVSPQAQTSTSHHGDGSADCEDVPKVLELLPAAGEADLEDLVQMVSKLEAGHPEVTQTGIVKLVLPEGWRPSRRGFKPEDLTFVVKYPCLQTVSPVRSSAAAGLVGKVELLPKAPLSAAAFHEMASEKEAVEATTDEQAEAAYWRSVRDGRAVRSGVVHNKSLVDPDVRAANTGKLGFSLLRVVAGGHDRAAQPRVEQGMRLSTRCWSVEPMELYLASVLLDGKPKTWYCVPPRYGKKFERLARTLFPGRNRCSNVLGHADCLVQPSVLSRHGIPTAKVVQRPGEVVLALPYAHLLSFDHGYNLSESVNFATERWVEYGKRHRPCACGKSGQPTFDVEPFVKRCQPERLEAWRAGEDAGPHPEDDSVERADDEVAELVREMRDLATSDYFVYAAPDGTRMNYDYKTDRLVARFNLGEEEKAHFEAWKAVHRKTFLVYRHCKLKDIRVRVDEETGRCSARDLRRLRTRLAMPALRNIGELSSSGVLVKTAKEVRRVPAAFLSSSSTDSAATVLKELKTEVTAEVYRHVFKNDVEAVVDPTTKELVLDAGPKLKSMLEVCPMSELIESGVMKPAGEKKLRCVKQVRVRETKEDADGLTVDVYHYVRAMKTLEVRVAPKSREFLGDPPSGLQEVMDGGKGLEDCVQEGVLKRRRTEVVNRKARPRTEAKNNGGKKRGLYWYPEKGRELVVDGDGKDIEAADGGENLSKEEELEVKCEFREMVAAGRLVHIGEVFPAVDDGGRQEGVEEQSEGGRVVEGSAKVYSINITDKKERMRVETAEGADGRRVLKVDGTWGDLDLNKLADTVKSLQPEKEAAVSAEVSALAAVAVTFDKTTEYELASGSGVRVRVDQETGRIVTEDAGKLGSTALAEMSARLLCRRGFLKNRKTAKAVSEGTRRAVVAILKREGGEEVKVDNSEWSELVATLPGVVATLPGATFLVRMSAYCDADVARVARAERDASAAEEEVVSAAYEVLSDEEDTDEEVSSDPELIEYSTRAPGGGGFKKKGRPKGPSDPTQWDGFTEQVRSLLRRMAGEQRRAGEDAEVRIDRERLDAIGIPAKTFETARKILEGMGIVREASEGQRGAVWAGFTLERTREALVRVLEEADPGDIHGNRWQVAKAVLNFLMRREPGRAVPLKLLVLELYYPDEDSFNCDHLEALKLNLQVLEGLNLVESTKKGHANYWYNGPNVYPEWRRAEFDAHRLEFSLRKLSCPVDKSSTEGYDPPPTKNVLAQTFDGQSFTKFKYREEMTRAIDPATLTPEQRRSVRHTYTVCTCGRGKRKWRCKRCEQCRAPNCGECTNCLNPRKKQACVGKVCLFPVIPDCPCFRD